LAKPPDLTAPEPSNMFTPSTAISLSMSPVRGPESLSLSALELQDAATIAFAAELHAVRWGAGMCVAARVARRIQYECARQPIVAWLSRMASECQCARRACTHISLAVEKMALQVTQQQQMISTLVGQIGHTHIGANEDNTAVRQECALRAVMKDWLASCGDRRAQAVHGFKAAFAAHNVAQSEAKMQAQAQNLTQSEADLAVILEECNQIKIRLKAAEEAAIANGKLELSLGAFVEEQEKLHTEGEGDATIMKDKLRAAETRNADLVKGAQNKQGCVHSWDVVRAFSLLSG